MNIIELTKQAGQRDYWLERFAALVEAAARADEREAAITAIQNIERKGGWVTREDAINAIRARETT